MNLILPPDLEAFVHENVKAGEFATVADASPKACDCSGNATSYVERSPWDSNKPIAASS